MAKAKRVHEIAKELGMTNAEIIDLSGKLGIGVKGPSSTIIDAQADRIRIRAEREGLTRESQPEEVSTKPVKKAAAKKLLARLSRKQLLRKLRALVLQRKKPLQKKIQQLNRESNQQKLQSRRRLRRAKLKSL